jgi:CubicO group peptidase (beta-lactamase class C family)
MTLDGRPLAPAELEATIAQAMAKANVAGLSVAILNDGQIAYTHAFGYRDRAVRVAFDTETVTGAASLSKTVPTPARRCPTAWAGSPKATAARA